MRFAKRSRALFELGVKRGEALADVSHRLARKLDIGCRRVCLDLLGLVASSLFEGVRRQVPPAAVFAAIDFKAACPAILAPFARFFRLDPGRVAVFLLA